MKILIILFLSLFSAMEAKEMTARVTYYWSGAGGQVGAKTSTGAKAQSGKTLAVDPKVIPYGSKVFIPQMGKTYVAQDTGSAVVSKKASKGKTIVVDVFCSSKSEADKYIKKFPMYMKVIVTK